MCCICQQKGVIFIYTVFDIANWFLSKESMNHKKLQKLCYYAQSWYYTLNQKPLINSEFEAWVHGAINRTLWYELKKFGYNKLSVDMLIGKSSNEIKINDVQFLESVWETYGEFTGYQLETLNLYEYPYINARKGLSELEPSSNIISVLDMQDYYYKLMQNDGVGE